MSSEENERPLIGQYDKPAVGVVATPTNADAIARVILRAKRHGYPTLVVEAGDKNAESVTVATQLGCHVLHLESPQISFESLRSNLAHAAKEFGFPGVVFHKNPKDRLDYDRSIKRFLRTNDYVVEGKATSISNDVSIVVGIPAYDEEDSIGEIVDQASEYADAVLVVDDGSADETANRARAAGAVVTTHKQNRGYGAALQTLFCKADLWNVDHLVVLDGDGQHNPADVERLVTAQRRTGAELVIGSRFTGSARSDIPRYRQIGLRIVNFLTNLSLGVVRSDSRISDTQSGFRAYDAHAIEKLAEDGTLGSSMDASTDILYHAHNHGYKIEEVSIEVAYDVKSGSSLNPVQHGIVLIRNIIKTIERDRPFTILGAPGFVGVLVGFGFGYWAFSDYIRTETFSLGLAVTSTLFLLTGIFACFTAIILHSLETHTNGGKG
ncbi:glycosyltransferase family 2 protein [Haladaptatus salinisoli]|uniref:glycosyltransferase family 2 protein n=1 Tax=Haladaptatus salinisoli TaxID=2884876 RepID=UPI001D0AD5E2|nr:glycosyltransferase family 2 protein [Haladaptatus salinisoli]